MVGVWAVPGARLPVAAVMADAYGRQIEEEVVLTSLINEVAAVPGGMCKHLGLM